VKYGVCVLKKTKRKSPLDIKIAKLSRCECSLLEDLNNDSDWLNQETKQNDEHNKIVEMKRNQDKNGSHRRW